jgi:hypothetical protein
VALLVWNGEAQIAPMIRCLKSILDRSQTLHLALLPQQKTQDAIVRAAEDYGIQSISFLWLLRKELEVA